MAIEKDNSDLKPTSMLATGMSQVKWRDQSIVGRKNDKMTNLLKMVLMTTMSKASSIIANTRKESTDDDNDDKSVKSDDCPRVNAAGSQLL